MSWQIILTAISGLLVILTIALKPKFFWPLLIIIACSTAGLMIKGYCLIDEFLLYCLLFGAFLAISIGAVPSRRTEPSRLDKFHYLFFFLLIAYLIIQSFRGLIIWGDWRIIRWIIFYLSLGLLSFIISKKDFPAPNKKQIILLIFFSTFFYFISYLAHGLIAEKFRGLSWINLQGAEWSGTAYAVFPMILAIPSALFLIRDKVVKYKLIGWLVLIILLLTGFYYDSRISFLTILAFLLISPFILKIQRSIIFLLCFLLIFSLFLNSEIGKRVFRNIGGFYQTMYRSTITVFLGESGQRPSDLDRYAAWQGALMTINTDWSTLFWGYGIHSSHFVMQPYLQKLYTEYLPGVAASENIRTTGIAAFLVEIGLIGMFLLIINFILTALKIISQTSFEFKITAILILLISFIWPFISNIQDIVLFYLLIMPPGLLIQFAKTQNGNL